MSYIKKAFLGVLAIVVVVGTVGAPAVRAQSSADMQAQIAALLAQVQALTAQLNAQGTVTTSIFTRNLTVGSTGADVTALQRFLNSHGCTVALSGAGSVGMESTYFGAKTKAAVACWQAAHNITPAVGYFGPTTRAAVNGMMVVPVPSPTPTGSPSPTPTGSPIPGVLQGGAGAINDADFISNLNNEQVGEDEEDVQVAGLRIEADDSSDIKLTAVRLVLVHSSNGAGSDDDFEDYADEVSVWFNGNEVARANADEFNDDNDYSKTLSLSKDAIIRADKTGDLVVAVSGIGNLDSDDEGETWTVSFDTVRFEDAQGAIISEDAEGDIGAETREFSFETFASASDVELEIVETSTNPESQIVEADDSDDTNDVLLLAGELRNNGDSDIETKELTVTIAKSGTGDISEIASSFILMIDGDEIQSVDSTECDTPACTATETYTFDDVDFTLGGGDSVDFEIRADINELDGVIVVEGDSLTASIDADTQISAEDESGEDLTSAEYKGTVTGNEQVFYTIFPEVSVVGDPLVSYVGDATDTANVTFKVKVTARGGTIYMNGDDEATAAKEAFQASVLGGDGNTVLSALVYTPSGTYTVTNNGADNEFYTITSGNSMTFTLSGSLSQTATTVSAGAEIDSIHFGTDATSDTTRSVDVVDFTDLTDDLETNLLTLIG